MHELLRSVLLALFMTATLKPQILTVPAYDGDWPTLGWGVIDWAEARLVHGPGDILGQRLKLDGEKVGFILRAYEIFPKGHPLEGYRRFNQVSLSLPKGSAKTELGAIIAAAELAPDAPVRFDRWASDGTPIGRPVNDPFVPMVAYTEKQSDELVYGALRQILLHSSIKEDFEIGIEKIVRRNGSGTAISLAGSPGGNDGARTTFQVFDETHHHTTPELLRSWNTMTANIPKRAAKSDPWTLEITTAFDPAEDSVARRAYNYARAVHEGRAKNAKLFYFHRQAPDETDWNDPEQRVQGIIAARGPYVSAWAGEAGIAAIAAEWDNPEKNRDFLARVWGNQIRHANARAFDLGAWSRRKREGYKIPPGAKITLGFDGAQTDDSTSLAATEVETGFQELLGLWERPADADEKWRIDEERVDEAVTDAFKRFSVVRMYADPWYWQEWLSRWTGRYTDKVVIEFHTNKWRRMADAVHAYTAAMSDPSPESLTAPRLSHSGDERFTRHIGNAFKKMLDIRDDKGERMHVIQKERKDSPHKMDAAMAGCLSWQARLDAIAEGIKEKKGEVFNQRAARGEERVIRCV